MKLRIRQYLSGISGKPLLSYNGDVIDCEIIEASEPARDYFKDEKIKTLQRQVDDLTCQLRESEDKNNQLTKDYIIACKSAATSETLLNNLQKVIDDIRANAGK